MLFFCDLMDLYVELRNFRFIFTFTFAAYYFLRVFFCMARTLKTLSILNQSKVYLYWNSA